MKDLQSTTLAIPDIKLLEYAKFSDHRGYFTEHFRENDFKQLSHVPPFWDPILEHVGSQILFLCILCV